MATKAVYIEWEDACSSGGWESDKMGKNHNLSICRTLGWVLVEDKNRVVIAQSIDGHEGNTDRIAIPIKCIRKRRRLSWKSK